MTSMRVLAAAGLLVLTIAGCGTGGSTSPASTAPAPTSTDSSASGGPLASTTTAPGGSDAPDGTPTVVFDDSPTSTSPASPSPELVITEVRVGSHAGYDRIVVELTGGSPDQVGWRVEYDDEPRTQGKGDEVDLPGSATLRVIVTGLAYPPTGTSTPSGLVADSAHGNVTGVFADPVFEGQAQIFIGLDASRGFHVSMLDSPTRIAVDIENS